jgi:hypothetical protein
LILKGTDPLADIAVTCDSTVVPIIYDKAAYRWSGRIDVAHDILKDGKPTVECELIGDKHWLDRILAWPAPFLPIWFQDPSMWFGMGPGLTVISVLIGEQALRIQIGILTFLSEVGSLDLNIKGWLQELMSASSLKLADILQVLCTPIVVVPINPLTDTSAWIEINGRMDTVWKLIQQQLIDNGFDISAVMWLPGEPQPKGLFIKLTKPTVVVQVFDRSGFTGPWGPFEGLVVDATQLQGALLGNTLQPLLGKNPQPYVNTDLGEYLAPNIGVDFVKPWIILDFDTDKGGIIEYNVDHHHALSWRVVVGGQSPKWVNDLINATLEWAVDSLMIAIGLTGLPSNILDGVLDNTLFAFSLADNFKTKNASPFMFPEKFFPSGAGALTVDTLFAEASALWNVRGYPAAKASWIDGYPYELGVDFFRSQLVLYVRRGRLGIDYIDNIEILDNRTSFNKVSVQLGDGKSEESPMTKFQRKLVGVETVINLILSGGNISSG